MNGYIHVTDYSRDPARSIMLNLDAIFYIDLEPNVQGTYGIYLAPGYVSVSYEDCQAILNRIQS